MNLYSQDLGSLTSAKTPFDFLKQNKNIFWNVVFLKKNEKENKIISLNIV